MKITYKNIESDSISLGHYSVTKINNHTIIESNQRKAILSGQLYRIDGHLCDDLSPSTLNSTLTALLSTNEKTLFNALEGIFILIAYDEVEDSCIRVYRSRITSHDIFYTPLGIHCISTDINDFDENSRPDNAALSCILQEGYCPSKHTPHKSIKRLGISQYLNINKGNISCNNLPTMETRINPSPDISAYYGHINNAIISRRSTVQNWVELSGGWDSTSTLGTLHKQMSKDIRSITTALILKDGTSFNEFEIRKSQDIADYYKVPHTVINFDLGDETLLESFYNTTSSMREHGIYDSCALWRPRMYDHIYKHAKKGAVCFNSLFSDSVHNFGFSQYVTMPDNDYIYREFADRMATYLWGPTFYSKINDDSYASDSIYRLFEKYMGASEHEQNITLSKPDRQRAYFLSFLYGDYGRKVPLSAPKIYELLTDHGSSNFTEFINNEYVDKACERANETNHYSVMLELYKNFYLQSGEQRLALSLSNNGQVNHASPFLDSALMEFLESMPESWGRGVCSHKPTKYPLKEFVTNNLDFPFEIMKKYKYHAYISETTSGRNIDFTHELLNNSIYSESLFYTLTQSDIEDHFDEKYFDIPALTSLLIDKTDSSPLRKRLLIYLSAMTIS